LRTVTRPEKDLARFELILAFVVIVGFVAAFFWTLP
jgi:hypothetical protein